MRCGKTECEILFELKMAVGLMWMRYVGSPAFVWGCAGSGDIADPNFNPAGVRINQYIINFQNDEVFYVSNCFGAYWRKQRDCSAFESEMVRKEFAKRI